MKITSQDLNKIKEFIKEKEKFYIISLIAKGEDSLLLSDLENYIIARSDIGLPIWIWTKEEISDEKTKEVEAQLEIYFESGDNKITSKKELYDYLKSKNELHDELEMGFLSCQETIKPEKGQGVFAKPDYTDKVILAEYWRANVKELYKKQISQWEALEEVERWLEDEKFFVLKDSLGEIVSMAGYGIVDDMAKITHVYTPTDQRRKGYCQYLIYSLSNKLLEKGYIPMLYTDYQYKASNEAYKKVGYKDQGTLMNYTIKR